MHVNRRVTIGLVLVALILAIAWVWAQNGELSTARCDQQETSFGDLTADALCADANAVFSLAAAVSFKKGAIQAAGATREQVASLLQTPEESWAVSRLTGAQLRKALERSLSRAPLPNNNAFLQVSGMTVVYDPGKPRDKRIICLTTAQGPIEPEAQYEVVMPLALAQGGSGYFQIFGKDDIIRQGTSALADSIVQYLQANPAKGYTGQGRLVVGG